ncbi:MAG: energy transducer TonB [Acidobacteria bacterium]|nr:energy transducer TonB [Acidobacteriota bacterium]
MRTLGVIALFGMLPTYAAEGWQVQRVVGLRYPPLAAQAQIRGVVTVSCVVGPAGAASDCTARSGHPLLQQVAVDNAKQWTFRKNSEESPADTTVEIEYAFESSGAPVHTSPLPSKFAFEFPNRAIITTAVPCPSHGPCNEEEAKMWNMGPTAKTQRVRKRAVH